MKNISPSSGRQMTSFLRWIQALTPEFLKKSVWSARMGQLKKFSWTWVIWRPLRERSQARSCPRKRIITLQLTAIDQALPRRLTSAKMLEGEAQSISIIKMLFWPLMIMIARKFRTMASRPKLYKNIAPIKVRKVIAGWVIRVLNPWDPVSPQRSQFKLPRRWPVRLQARLPVQGSIWANQKAERIWQQLLSIHFEFPQTSKETLETSAPTSSFSNPIKFCSIMSILQRSHLISSPRPDVANKKDLSTGEILTTTRSRLTTHCVQPALPVGLKIDWTIFRRWTRPRLLPSTRTKSEQTRRSSLFLWYAIAMAAGPRNQKVLLQSPAGPELSENSMQNYISSPLIA